MKQYNRIILLFIFISSSVIGQKYAAEKLKPPHKNQIFQLLQWLKKKAPALIFCDSEFEINLYKVTKDGLYFCSLLPDEAKILKPGEWAGFTLPLPKK